MENLERYKTHEDDFNFIDFAYPIADYYYPIKYSPNGSYTNKYFLICLIDFVKRGISWTNYEGTIDYPIKGKYLNEIHNKYINAGVYDQINKALVQKYLETDKAIKLKHQMIDSSFIANKRGSVKNNNHLLNDEVKQKNKEIRKMNQLSPDDKQIKEETFIDFNRYNGRKKYNKISTITDSYGIPLANTIISAKQHDCMSIEETIDKIPVDLGTLKNSQNNRYKQYMLADSGYDSRKNAKYLKQLGYTPIIAYNKRNTQNKEKIKKRTFTKNEKVRYKKRSIIESYFSWIKNYPIINQNYQKTISSYYGLLTLVSCIFISKRV
jgi:hypothetical protein